jgi:RimJ/RimL family protein N-acetyltransferase
MIAADREAATALLPDEEDYATSGDRVIETTRLLLRLPEAADAQALMEIYQDPEVLEQGGVILTAPPGGIEVALRNVDRLLRHWKRYDYGQWSVVEKATEQVVGCVGFYHRDELSEVEVGWIIRRSHWGRGFATEAARAVIDWAWRTTTIDHIVSVIQPTDARSMRVAEKSGLRFEREGVERVNSENRSIFGIYRHT